MGQARQQSAAAHGLHGLIKMVARDDVSALGELYYFIIRYLEETIGHRTNRR